MSNCSNIYANSALQCDYISFPLLKRNSPRLYRFKKMLKENSLRRNDLNNTTEVKEASTKSKPSILKETRKMSTFPWLNHGSLIQSRSVWTEACAGAEGSARDIAPTLPSLGGKNGIERLVLLPTSVSDLSWCFGSMYKNPYKCYVKRLDRYFYFSLIFM